jgi:hypothetical protein
MPAIIEAKCNKCDYTVRRAQSETYLVRENGYETILAHPGERLRAKKLTEKSFGQLAKEGRIHYKYGLICRNCGEYDLYERINSVTSKDHISSIFGWMNEEEVSKITCTYCGEKMMQNVMGEQIGCLAFLLGKRPKKNEFACPKCYTGTVEIKPIGKS